MTAPTKPLVLVTGDIVLDSHLYGGVRTGATSFAEPGTTYQEHLGGAALTHKLLEAAADAPGRQWVGARASLLPRDLPQYRPEPSYDVRLGLEKPDLTSSREYGQLRSYGVWGKRPAKKGSNEHVWRIDRHYGYGPSTPIPKGGLYKPIQSKGDPTLTVIDDGGVLFRRDISRDLWPSSSSDSKGHYLLKMSAPLCRGDLWGAEHLNRDRLIVVVSAADLRREDAQVSKRLSWEQCAESTLRALKHDPVVGQLLTAAHLIINFRSGGALWIAGGATGSPTIRLIFDHLRLEEHFDREFEGTVYGFQTCLTAGIVHRLLAQHLGLGTQSGQTPPVSPFTDASAMRRALESGIVTGLAMQRRLLELGHGPVNASKPTEPGFPIAALAAIGTGSTAGGFNAVDVPADALERPNRAWTVLAQTEEPGPSAVPFMGLAHLTARYGVSALSHVPALKLGGLFTVDRSEIESLRTLYALIHDYEDVKVQEKPLCIGVFGPPGSGKSFGVKALAKGILGEKLPPGEKVPILEFNLSQFKSADELIGALHRVRDAVLKGTTPVAFWDEFDSQHYKWLQYLLAPMQDGAFQEGQVTHPIGKCVFVFAGGTSDTIDEFGVQEPVALTDEKRQELTGDARADRKEDDEKYLEFKRLKGPDFISRLHGFLNVLGVNQNGSTDVTWPIRRALILRGMLKLKDNEELNIDPGLLDALLRVKCYKHGSRSLEKIVVALVSGRDNDRLHRAALPPDPSLDRETDAQSFRSLIEQGSMSTFKNYPDIEILAAAVHSSYLAGAEKAAQESEVAKRPEAAWKPHPAVMRAYDDLSEDLKASNRAAARRVPELLVLIDFMVTEQQPNDGDSWVTALKDAIELHIDRLARAEHLGWCAERRANGWTYAKDRDNDRKHHPLLVDWAQLSESDREKDRSSARSIPGWLKVAGFKAVRVSEK